MTVANSVRTAGPFVGNGVTVSLPFTFRVLAATDLMVVRAETATGVESTLTYATDYTVTLNADQNASPGGSVTLASPLATGYKAVLTTELAATQLAYVTNAGGFFPEVFNNVFDKLTILVQQALSKIGRTVKVPITSGLSDVSLGVLANGILKWNASGTALDAVDPTSFAGSVANATVYADQFTGTGAQTAFALSAPPGVLANLKVSVAGVVKLPTTDYTLSGSTLTFIAAPANAAKILAQYQQSAVVVGAPAATNEYQDTVASSATPDIWSGNGNQINMTGTATVTGFAAAPRAGSARRIVLAGAVTFNNGANLLVQGGANVTLAVGDIVWVLALTTTQFRLAIEKASGLPTVIPDPTAHANYVADQAARDAASKALAIAFAVAL